MWEDGMNVLGIPCPGMPSTDVTTLTFSSSLLSQSSVEMIQERDPVRPLDSIHRSLSIRKRFSSPQLKLCGKQLDGGLFVHECINHYQDDQPSN